MTVAPLEVPDTPLEPAATPAIADLVRYSALTLFVQRAQAVRPTFELNSANVDEVVKICRRLDGLPLAIELAAAHIRVLSPAKLLARLDRRLAVLTTGTSDAPERQQTLRATLDWSYELLKPPARRLLCRLAAFTGGWTLEAAEAVCAEAERLGVERLGGTVLAALESLVEHSLARQTEYLDGEIRYSLLETVREYAFEQLEASGEGEVLRHAQANYYLSLPPEVASESLGETVIEGLNRLQREYANLRSALGWALERGETQLGLRLADALGRFWWRYGHLREGRGWLEALLAVAVPGEVPVELRARAVHGAGVLATAQGDSGDATMLLRQAVALYRECGDIGGAARALNTLGGVAYDQGDLDGAVSLFEQSLSLQRQMGDLGEVARELGNLGEAIYRRGDPARAQALYEEALALARQVGREETVATQLGNLANLARRRGDPRRAAMLLRECLENRQSPTDLRRIANNLERCATIAAAVGQMAPAARLLGAATQVRRSIGAVLPPPERVEIEQAVAGSRAALGEAVWEAETAAGGQWSFEEAIVQALRVLGAINEASGDASGEPKPMPPQATPSRDS